MAVRSKGEIIKAPFRPFFMYHELKKLFGGKKPSVRKFNLALRALSLEEQNRYYKAAYDAAFTEWDTLPRSYQTFLRDLLMHDKQRTADYLRRHTVLGVLGYPLREPELLRRLLALLEQGTSSYRHLAFALLLVFPYPENIDYLSDKLRLERLTTDDLCELLDRMQLDNEPGRVFT